MENTLNLLKSTFNLSEKNLDIIDQILKNIS